MRRVFILFISLFLASLAANATHNRAGEITYRHISGFTYEITVTTCTKSSVEADREFIFINWGDSPACVFNDSIQRNSIQAVDGFDAQLNTYIAFHTYAGAGAFMIQMIDPNRNENIVNIFGSVNIPFYIESELIISPLTGHNNSVILLNSSKTSCCLSQLWVHNPGAYDPDGDILVYSLVDSKGELCEPIDGYLFPDEATADDSDTFTIDSSTGTVIWDVPPMIGEFNLGILIEEFRDVDGVLIKVGSVLRDMQVLVSACDNEPPVIQPILDTCVVINVPLILNVFASDPDGDDINLSAIGGPLTEVENTAQFNNNTGQFTWIPECVEVRLAPYQVLFIAEDESFQEDLVDIETVNITVIAPPVNNPNAEAIEGTIVLTWSQHQCITAYDESELEDFSYKIYRRNDEFGFVPGHCETGVPAYTGYSLIGTVEGFENTGFIDETAFFGGYYCYMIVACWPDGSESLATEEFCAQIEKDVPVITNVTVLNTDLINGVDSIAWSPPTELDLIEYAGPYQYKLYWSAGNSNPATLIYESPVDANLFMEDTIFVHNNLNTFDTPNTYNVEIYSGSSLIATTSDASSVFITLIPDDNQLTIEIDCQVPWQNNLFEIYRLNGSDWELIGTTEEKEYIDTELTNSVTYCYFVRSIGTYDAQFVVDPIINDSQEACGFPVDLTAPCPPELTIEAECIDEISELTWTNPNATCGDDDVMLYQLYYTPIEGEDFTLIKTFLNDGSNDYTFNEEGLLNSIAGCFYITAVDSLQPGIDGVLTSNESDPSNVVCIDNCPEYNLPNIFTPNGDDVNQVFRPFDPILYIDSVSFMVFNRWGGLVFETDDPLIGWDGRYDKTGELCPDGTYYYTATVFTIRLEGIVPEDQSGYIRLLGGKDSPSE